MPTVRGKVVDYNTGRPVVGASVSVAGRTTRTNSNGEFIVSAPAGDYTITVSHRDYTPTPRMLNLTVDQTITIRMIPRVGLL